MLNKIAHKFKLENLEKLWFVFSGEKLLLTNKMEIPHGKDLFQNCLFARQLQLDYTDSSHLAAELTSNSSLPTDMELIELKKLYHLLPSNLVALAGKARQLIEWDKSHKFCGECGSLNAVATNEHSRTCMNPSCKRIVYPRISPVIIVAVERNQEILLARSPHFPINTYSVLAGFIEAGETVEESVHREVFEETGIKIKNLRYFASQPWPFPNSLMLGFQADYESGNIVCATNEIEDAAFFHIAALPQTFPGNVTISQWLLHDFCRRYKGKI